MEQYQVIFECTDDNCTNFRSILQSVGDSIFTTKADEKHLPCFSLRSIVVDFLAKAKQHLDKRYREIYFSQCYQQNFNYNSAG